MSKSPRAGKVGMAWKRLRIAWAYFGPGAAATVAGVKFKFADQSINSWFDFHDA